MAEPSEKLAESLEVLRNIQQNQGFAAIQTSEISRVHRERLMKNGFLNEVAKGWYIVCNPGDQKGESTAWYTSYWQFCSRYLENKYGEKYTVSAEQSIALHAENYTVPNQMIIRAENGSNKTITLLFETSLFIMKSPLPNVAEIEVVNGIRSLTLASALIHCTSTIYERSSTDMRAALAQITTSSQVTRLLLGGSHSVIAGRLAGAFRNIGQDRIADDIIKTMKAADYKIREIDPFVEKPKINLSFRERSPYVNRVRLMWAEMREVVLKYFPSEPGLPSNTEKYLKSMDELYVTDAYHSLSIEQYVVSIELIEKVRSGNWNLDDEEDKKHRDAMAARGYFQATQSVKDSIKKILNGENPGKVLDYDHGDWYRELFAPSVTAGILKAGDLAGYRDKPVYISNSQHVPMNKDAVVDVMPVLFELLETEKNAGVRVVLGHFVFVYIHPYIDGNGRMGRFLMNSMLASGGYPWTVIPVEETDEYMKTLEEASVSGNIEPFTKFLSYLVNESIKGTPVASIK
jgi:hypothetical protein